jgi:hypothetical protein
MKNLNAIAFSLATIGVVLSGWFLNPQEKVDQSKTTGKENLQAALIDGSGAGWEELEFGDFANINCKDDTWSSADGLIKCNGNCNGGFRSTEQYTNFEMVMEWKHLTRSGNAGVFIWSPKNVVDKMKPGELPQGIEIQILDHGYAEDYEKNQGKKSDWFTTHGDVFPCGVAKMKPFEPSAPNGQRAFPSANHSRGFGQWNHYYIRAINGEVRLWVNGHEVAGGNECSPASGFIALEAEGAPVDYRNIRVRVLP